MTYVIGVDSGGTHIVGQALTLAGEILAQTQSGPGNIFLDQPQTISNLTTIVTTLLQKLGRDDCQYILMGIAGVETTGNGAQVAADFTAKWQLPTYVISDAQLALLNGLEGHDGTLVIAGTGSVVYGRQNQQMWRYGGWGQLLGDTGSAYQIVAEAMKMLLKDYDLGRDSELAAILLPAFSATDPKQAVKHYYQLSRKEIAAVAVKIAQAAAAGNQAATNALVTQANALADEVLGLISRYQQPIPEKIAFSGSVLVHNSFYRETLLKKLQNVHSKLEPIVVSTNNGRGAIFWSCWHQVND